MPHAFHACHVIHVETQLLARELHAFTAELALDRAVPAVLTVVLRRSSHWFRAELLVLRSTHTFVHAAPSANSDCCPNLRAAISQYVSFNSISTERLPKVFPRDERGGS